MRICKRRLFLLVVPLAILGAYFGWGLMLAARYEARLDELRAAGEPVTFEDLLGPPVPDEENGAALILQAGEIFEQVDSDFLCRLSMYPDSEEGAERPVGEALPLLVPCFERIDEALRRPVISLPPTGSKQYIQSCGFESALAALRFKSHFEPTAELVDTHLDLADRLTQRMFFEEVGKFVTLRQALLTLRRGLERGSIPLASHADRWRVRLRNAESGHEARFSLRSERVNQIHLFEQYRLGEDPFEQARKTVDDVNKMVEDSPLRFLRFPERPWYCSWYGHPVLNRRALDALENVEERMAEVDDEDAMRGRMSYYFRMALKFRSVVRLARVFLAIKQRGEPLPRIEDYFPEGGMPLDALTGKPFRYQRTEDGAFIAAGKRASRESVLEDLLAWEIRYD